MAEKIAGWSTVLSLLNQLSHLVKLCPDDAFFRSINRMPHVESRMWNETHSDDCPHDASAFSRLPLDGINLLGKTFRLWFTNVT